MLSQCAILICNNCVKYCCMLLLYVNYDTFLNNIEGGSEFSCYEIELRNRTTQNDVTLRVTDSKIFKDSLLSSY